MNGPERSFTYVLKTGASWKGTIGRARIVCDIAGLRARGPLQFQPAGGKIAGRKVVWEFRNFEPNKDIVVRWFEGFVQRRGEQQTH
jgi:hypothetical protein